MRAVFVGGRAGCGCFLVDLLKAIHHELDLSVSFLLDPQAGWSLAQQIYRNTWKQVKKARLS